MPELPEVQTITDQLQNTILGKIIAKIETKVPKMLSGNPRNITGASIKKIERRAKNIVIQLSGGNYLLFHLKMTGQLFYLPQGQDQTSVGEGFTKHTHITIDFADDSRLIYNDVRKFGWLQILSAKELDQYFAKQKYGPDPLTSDFNLSWLQLIQKKRPRVKIKQIIMDQQIVPGVGNIYADESLFVAKIKPDRHISDLTKADLSKMVASIKKVLKLGIKYKGTSVDSYRQVSGARGTYDLRRFVYQRAGEPCQKCGTKIEKIKIGGRGTHYCPHCQK